MLTRTCILFILVFNVNVFAGTEDLKTLTEKIEKSSCEQFLTIAPPSEPGPAPKIPSGWATLGQILMFNLSAYTERANAIHADKQHQQKSIEYAQYITALNARKKSALEQWSQKFSSELQTDVSAFVALASQLREKGTELINNATTDHQLHQIELFLDRQYKSLNVLIYDVYNSRKLAEAVFGNFQKQMRNSPQFAQVNSKIKASLKEVYAATSLDAISAVVTETESELLPLLQTHIENERLRPEKELRFDTRDTEKASAILEAFLSLNKNSSVSFDKNAIVTFLELNDEAREFLYYELQTARRLLKTADRISSTDDSQQVRAGATLRIENDLQALNRASTTDKKYVSTIKLVRKNLLTLRHQSIFQGVEGAEDLKRTNVVDREALVRDALALPELQVMIQTAALDLLQSLAPPTLPVEPSRMPPQLPNIPRKARSRTHANQLKAQIAKYKKDVEQFKKSWEDYKQAVPLYRDKLVPEYRKRAEGLKTALISRHLARQSYISFLSMHYPHLFSNSATAEKIRLKTVNLFSRKEADMAREEAKKRDYYSSYSDWLTYQYMMNPIWMINRDIAIMMPLYFYHHYDPSPKNKDEDQPVVITVIDPSRQDTEPPVDRQMPDIQNLDIQTPIIPDIPDVQLPDIQLLDIQIPDVTVPDVNIDIDVPDIPTVIDTPSITIDTPSISIDTPSISIDTSF